MSNTKIPKDMFKRLIQRRAENTKALEEKKRGYFEVKRFQPIHEKASDEKTGDAVTDSKEEN